MGKDSRHHKLTLSIQGKTSVVSMDKDLFCVGRSQEADVVISEDVVSKKHLEITIKNGRVSVRDLKSRNGTTIDGMKLQPGVDYPVHRDSEVWVGDSSVTIRVTAAKPAPVEASRSRTRADMTEEKLARVMASLTIAEEQLARVKKESEEESSKLEERRRAALALVEEAEGRQTEASRRERALDDREAELEATIAVATEEVQTAQRRCDQLRAEAEHHAADRESARAEIERTRAEAVRAQAEIRELARQTEAALARHSAEVAEHEERENNLRKQLEALEAEAKVTRLRIDGENEKLAALKRAGEDEVRLLELRKQKEELDLAMTSKRAEQALADILERTRSSIAEGESARKALEETERARSKASSELDSIRRDAIRAEELKARATAEAETLTRTARETEEKAREIEAKARAAAAEAESLAQERSSQLTAKARESAAQTLEKARESAAQTLETARAEAEASAQAIADKQASALADQARKTEAELNNRRIEALESIERMREREHRITHDRRNLLAEAVVRRAQELAESGKLSKDPSSLRELVHQVLDGRVPEVASIAAETRNRDFWRRVQIGAGLCVLPVLLYLFFPQAPKEVGQAMQRKIASSSKDDGGAFMEQIRQKGAAYKPAQDKIYRGSYAENVLFFEGYSEIKLSEARQKEWTLALSAFLTKDLGLDDRVLVELVSAETVLVKELARIRETIVEQYKDQGRARMDEAERGEIQRIKSLLKTPENYEKFRAFEKSFVSR